MKKVFILFFIFQYIYSFSQNDLSNFVDSSNAWYNYGGSFPINGQYMRYHRFYFYQGDTMIGSQLYKKMYKQVKDSVFSTNTSPYQMNYPLFYEAAFRQVGQKVYFVQPDSLVEKLYIDFDMQIGDTVNYCSFGSSIKTVTAIDSIPFGNQYRKRFSTTGGIIYEGIGHTYGVFRDNGLFIEGGDYLSCFRQYGENQDVYAWSDDPECPELNLTTNSCQFIIEAFNNGFNQNPTVMIDGAQSYIYLFAYPLLNDSSTITYQWQLNGINITGANTSNLVADTPGNYTVLTNSDGCQSTSTISITSEPVTIVPNPDVNLCYNQSNCNYFQSNHPATTYSWVTNSSTSGIPNYGSGQVFCFSNSNLNQTTDTIEVIVTPCLNGFCGVPDTFYLFLLPQTIGNMPDLSFCHGDPIPDIVFQNYLTNVSQTNWNYQGYIYKDYSGNYVSSGYQSDIPYNGQGTIPSFESENSSSNLIKYHYFVAHSQDSNSNCWNYGDTFNIIVYHKPNVSAGSDQTICEGIPVTLSASGAMNYNWNNTIFSEGVISFIPTSTNYYTVVGVDSIFGCTNSDTVIVTVVPTSYSNEVTTVCDSYTWHGNTYSTSGIYTANLTNISGCDSIVTLTLNINYSNSFTENISACNLYTWHGITYTSSGIYSEIYTNLNGCDSIVTLNLTINQPDSSSSTIEACGAYTWHGNTYSTSGTYTATFTNVNGCDSTATLNLTINTLPETPIVTVSNDTILSITPQSGVQYQWISCDSGLPIQDANAPIFSASSNGNYAVIVSNSCGADTSNCVFSTNSIVENQTNYFQVYPNPTWDKIFLQSSTNLIGQDYIITDFSGRTVQAGKISSEKQEISLVDLRSGVYFLTTQNKVNKLKINKL